MAALIGIRAEDKNRWERRAPLTPDHVQELVADHGVRFTVQPSRLRIFPEVDYQAAGAAIGHELDDCTVVLGVKEVPVDMLQAGTTYVFFSHVIKGQASNMPLLRRLIELGCTLIDYERITDRKGRRLIFFGRHAGYAGMIDSLWALGQRLAWEGFSTPLEELRLAHQYQDLSEATAHIGRIGERIRHTGLPAGLRPVVFAFTGSGNVSRGAQEVCDRLPIAEASLDELPHLSQDRDRPQNILYKIVLERSVRVARSDDGGYDETEYGAHPERYESCLGGLLRHVTVLINGIYWEPGRPRLVTADHIRGLYAAETQPKLRVIGDITCDVGGSVEITTHATTPGDPVFVWDPDSGDSTPGVEGRGPVVMAVDNLPCELPVEASEHFGDSLVRFVPPLARCDWEAPLDELALPEEIRRAIVVHRGALTPSFAYLEDDLHRAAEPTRWEP